MNYIFKYSLALIMLIALTTSCGNIKYLECQSSEQKPKKRKFIQHWVNKNTIKFSKQKYKIQEDSENLYTELEATILQSADRSILRGFRKWVYHTNDDMSVRYIFDKKLNKYRADTIKRKQKGIRPWLHKKVGTAPIILDTTLVERSRKSMQRLLNQKAYFDAKVTYDIVKKKHKSFVTYNIVTGKPLLIDEVDFISKDSAIQKILDENMQATLLKPKTKISAAELAAEKQRLTLLILNKGYFNFNWKYIVAEADTTNVRKVAPEKKGLFQTPEQGEPRANIYIEVLPYSDTSIVHPRYKIADVYIIPNEYILLPHKKRIIRKDSFFIVNRTLKTRNKKIRIAGLDKLIEGDRVLDTIAIGNKQHYLVERTIKKIKKITLLNRAEMLPTDEWVHTLLRKKYTKVKDFYIRDKVISDVLAIKNGDWYNKEESDASLKKINNLAVFRFPRIEYVPAANGKEDYLDCFVKMQPSKKQAIGFDAELNNNSTTTVSSLGVAGNVTYRNKNIFKGAEIFELTAQLGIDFKLNPDSSSSGNSLSRWINLLDFNAEASFYFPKFIGLNFIKRALKMDNVRTKMSLGYRYLQQADDFQISSFYGRMGYTWAKGVQHQFSWNPILVNFTLEPTLNPTFEQLLADNNVVLLNSLKAKYLIPSMDFTYTFSSKQMGKGTWFFKTYFEVAGNLLNLVDLAVEPNKPIRIFDVDYSQYFRTDVDLRYSYKLTKKHSIVGRLALGIIVPYGNSIEGNVPFIKRYTLGGPNSMRAWNLRTLGPGTQKVVPGAEFQMGDISMEFNLEYRFMFNSWIGGALFADVGNIWLLESSVEKRGFPYQATSTGVFDENFYNQLALGVGAGIRFDFSFFIIRIDLALQLRDPQGYGLGAEGTTQYWNVEPFILRNRHKFILAIGYPF